MSQSVARLWARSRAYIAADQAAPACAVLESLLLQDPGDIAARMMLGGLYAAEDRQRAATRQVLEASRQPPDDPGLLGDLITTLIKVGEIVAARRLLALPAIAGSASAHVLMRAASQLQLIGDHAAALALMEKAAAAGASGRDFEFLHAVQLAFNGKLQAAEAELLRCIARDPPLGRAYVQLARTRRQTAQANHLDAIGAALRRVEGGSEDHAALQFAQYKELEDLQRYDEAWSALQRGNAIMHARLPYDAAEDATRFALLQQTCTPEFLRAEPLNTDGDGPQPIFVIGMPRSGTTVLERLLGGHSQVTSVGELGEFPRALNHATDHLAPVMFDATTLQRLPAVDWRETGATYLAQSRWRARGKAYYVDKLPRNWMLAGLIHKALPHAPIIHLVRDPMDVCFSNWRAYFGPGLEYAWAYDQVALATHYRQYRAVMAHWHAALPGVILDVPYARLVREPEAAAREILAYCGLPWEPGCVDLSRNHAPSATLSMSQVRQFIRADAFREWEPYAEQLAELRAALA